MYWLHLQGAAFNVTHFESRITHLLYTAINTTEHSQVSQCLGFTKSLTSSIQRLGDVLHDNQGIAAYVLHSPGNFCLGLVTFSGPPIHRTLLQLAFFYGCI